MSVRALTLITCTLFAGVALAADKPGPNDWPQYRGHNRDGKSPEKGLLKSWPKDGPSQAWTAKDLGSGFAAPSIAASKIFGMGSRNGKDGAFALNEADGTELWFTPLDDVRNANQNIGPSSTPTYADGFVYTVSNKNGVIAKLDAKTGKVAWQKNYVKDFGGGTPSWGYCDSVLIDGDLAICTPSGKKGAMAALKIDTGEVKWTAIVPNVGGGAGYCSPVKMTVGGVPMYVVVLGKEGGTIGVHAVTGKLLWQHTKNAYGGVAQVAAPIISGDRIFVSTAYAGGSALLQVVADGKDKVTVKELWSTAGFPMNHHGNMILIDEKVYFGHGGNNGLPVCWDMKSGDEVWRAKSSPQGAGGSAAYSYADGMLYIRYENGLLTLVKPSGTLADHQVVSQFKLPKPDDSVKQKQSWAPPVIANGKLYIRDHNMLYCYNIKGTTN